MTVHRGLEVRAGHRYRIDTIKLITARDRTGGFSMLGAHSVHLFIAESPVHAIGPRKFVFDEFWLVQGPHVGRILQVRGEPSTKVPAELGSSTSEIA